MKNGQIWYFTNPLGTEFFYRIKEAFDLSNMFANVDMVVVDSDGTSVYKADTDVQKGFIYRYAKVRDDVDFDALIERSERV